MRTPERKDGGKMIARLWSNWRNRRGFTLVEILAVMAILSIMSVSLFTMFQQGTGTWRKYSAWTEANLKARQILEMMSREIRGAVVITTPRGPDADAHSPNDPGRADFRGLNGQNPPGPDSTWNSVTLQGWRTREQKFSDQVFFVAPATNSARQELCLVGYWIEDPKGDTSAPLPPDGVPGNSKDDTLRRCYLTDGGLVGGQARETWEKFDFPGADSMNVVNAELALNVRQLEIKYYNYELRGGSTPVLKEYNAWDSLPTTFPGQEKGTTPTKDDDDRLPVAVRITIVVGDENDVIKPLKLSTIVYLENAPRTGTTGG